MGNNGIGRFLFVVGVALFALVLGFPWTSFDGFNAWAAKTTVGERTVAQIVGDLPVMLGLDLAGGTELDYELILDEAREQNTDEDAANDVNIDRIAESVRDSLEARVNPAGVGEVLVKRSSVDDEEHVLIQLPPSYDVARAKQSAERDNRLDFFEEDPSQSDSVKTVVVSEQDALKAGTSWDDLKAKYENDANVTLDSTADVWISEMTPESWQEEVRTNNGTGVLTELFEGRAQLKYTIGEDGQLQIENQGAYGVPPEVIGLAYVTEFGEEEDRETASHILFGYKGASRAAEDVQYENAEAAKAKAEEILALVTSGGQDFAEAAQEYSTGPSAPNGGSLGVIQPGQMVPAFDAIIFGTTDEETGEVTQERSPVGIYPEVVETEFGYHIINVTEPAKDRKVTYEQLQWNIEDLNWTETELGGKQLETASVGFNEVGQPVVNLLFDSEGGQLFTELTERVAARSKAGECQTDAVPDQACRLGIKVGGQWMTQPTVRQTIFGRQSQISGAFTFEGANDLATGLNLGAIDAPVRLSGEIKVQAELGESQLQKSLKAGALGLLLTMIFMIIVYRYAGFLASIALLIYAGLFTAIMKVSGPWFDMPIVLSLAGVAGIALSIGLAVDANVLIFERMKEEIKKGKTLRQAVELGFDRAWSAIRDSNITTIITAFILYTIGSSIVKGFAVTLILGTLLSLFTAVFITKALLHLSLNFKSLRAPWLYGVSSKNIK